MDYLLLFIVFMFGVLVGGLIIERLAVKIACAEFNRLLKEKSK